MNIIVCVKQVPDSQDITIDPVKKTLNRSEARAVINPPDENALELGLSLKEKFGAKVTVISMGPPMAESAIRECIARGADEGILITDRAFAGADTYPTSLTLAATINKLAPYDLIICGEETTDSSTGHVGPGIAEHLNLPQATYIVDFKYDKKTNLCIAKRYIEGGFQLVQFSLPAVVTTLLNMNSPRVPTLKGKLRAREEPVKVWKLTDIGLPPEWVGLKGSPTKVDKIKTEEFETRNTVYLEGTVEHICEELVKKLRERNVID